MFIQRFLLAGIIATSCTQATILHAAQPATRQNATLVIEQEAAKIANQIAQTASPLAFDPIIYRVSELANKSDGAIFLDQLLINLMNNTSIAKQEKIFFDRLERKNYYDNKIKSTVESISKITQHHLLEWSDKNPSIYYLVKAVTKHSKELEQYILQQRTLLLQKKFGPLVILSSLDHSNKAPDQLVDLTTKYIINNFNIFMQQPPTFDFIVDFAKKYPQTSDALAPLFSQHLMHNSPINAPTEKLLLHFMNNDKLPSEDLVKIAINKLRYLSPASLYEIMKNTADTNGNIKKELLSDPCDNLAKLLKIIAYHTAESKKSVTITKTDTSFPIKPISQTEQHLVSNKSSTYNSGNYKFLKNHNLIHMANELHNEQKKLEKAGYYTFVHGQRWEYIFLERWFTWLYGLSEGISINDFIIMRIKRPSNNLVTEAKTRKKYLKSGSPSFNEPKAIQHMMFLNYALFGNSTNTGSSTAHYISTNNNIHSPQLTMKDVFTFNGYANIYEHFEKELEELKQEHALLSKYGAALLFAIPSALLKETVMIVEPGGLKTTITIDGKSTDDIKFIMDTLRSNPSKIADTDQMEFVIILTWDIALNPKSGIKIFDFNTVDPNKMKAFKNKEQKLFEQIRQTIINKK